MAVLKNQVQVSTEKQIERAVCDYLDTVTGGFVCQIELSGRPIKKGFKTIMIPFNGKHYRTGMSDILFFYKGTVYAFEVKTPTEHRYAIKHHEKITKTPKSLLNPKQKHFHEQITFIENIKSAGGFGAFVSSVDQVREILLFTNR